MTIMENIKNIDKGMRDAFYNISNTNAKKRHSAIQCILKVLVEKQQNDEICSDLDYALNRLVKGVASGMEAARTGFTVLLTEVLKIFPQITLTHVLDLYEKYYVNEEMGTDINVHVSKMMVLSAIINSKKYTEQDMLKLSNMLLSLLEAKPYTKIMAIKLFERLTSQTDIENVEKYIYPSIEKYLKAVKGGGLNVVNLWFYLYVNENYNALLKKHKFNISSRIDKITKVIKTTTEYLPQIHPVCQYLVRYLIKNNGTEQLENLIMTLLNDKIEKKILGLNIIKISSDYISELPDIKIIYSRELKNILYQSLKVKQSPLKETLNTLLPQMENSIITLTDSEKLYEIIEYFIPHLNYPQIKKMVQNVISQNPNSSMLLSRIIQQIQVEESSHLRNLWISLFPSFYVNNRDNKEEDANNPTEENTKERDDALKFIALWSFFNVKQENTLPFCDTIPVDVNPEFRRSCQHVLMNMLKTGCSSPTLEKRLELGISYLHPLVKYLIKLSKSSEFIEPALEEYNIELLTTIKTALTKIKKQDGKNEKLFEFLFLYMSLLIFLEPESSEQLLQDLVECHRRSTGKAEEDDGPHWSQVLMDIMLALLSTEGKVTLYFIHGLFACYLPLVTKDSLQQILEAISPKKDEEDAMEIDEEEGSEDDDEGGESSNEAGKKEEVSFSKMDLMEVDAPDEEEEEEELLSDSEMFKLDAALAQVISKSRKASKKTKEAEAQKEMSYTLRCLDLLDILFKKESPSAAFAILTIQPLVDAIIANPKSGILLKRVNHLLEQLYKKRKAMKEEVDRNVMKDLIQSLLQSLKKVKQERKHIAVIITQMICLAFYLYEHHVDEYVNPGQFGSYLSAIVQEHATTNSYPTFPILLEKYFQVYNVDPSVNLLQHVIDAIFSSDIRPARRTRLVGSLQRIMKSLKHYSLLRDTYSTEICNKSFKLMETLPATSHVFKEFVVLLYAILDECSKVKLPQDLVDKLGQMKRKLPKDGKLAQRYLLEYHKHNDN